ncbi:hypothetical protein FPV67DRAFT_508993 [Lyophyllum atratum]|nr:hypothetical protein FPV67DRAFT_508993 [Lyophyllum atratum]
MDELQRIEARLASLQEQYDTQASSFQQRNSYHEMAREKLEADLASSQKTLETARQELLAERAALVAASLDFALKLASHEETQRMLEVTERRSDVLEGVMQRMQHLEHQQVVVGEGAGERVKVLEAEMEELGAVNRGLSERAQSVGRLKERYASGELMDDEKDFVEWLIKLSNELHEQEDVAKDNELRRRENMITKMEGKIRELESALARILKQKEKDSGVPSKSMIDLNAWMTSSPAGPDPGSETHIVTAPTPADTIMAPIPTSAEMIHKRVPIALAPAQAPTPKRKSARTNSKKAQQQPTPSFRDLDSFSSLGESDSEDDIPLSEMSGAATSVPTSVLGKRERAVSPVKTMAKVETKSTGNVNANGRRLRGTRPAPELLRQEQAPVGPKKAVDTNSKAKKKRK